MKRLIMKTKIFKIIAIMLILTGSFFSCTKRGYSVESVESVKVEIPVVGYSLAGTGCWWTNLESEKVAIVNSNKELEKYIESSGNDCPTIDFSEHTLLLTCGATSNGVAEINTTLFKDASEKYTLKVEILLTIVTVAEGWRTAILTPKLTSNTNIVLDVQQSHNHL